MATVQSLITSARYDLRDYGKGLIYDNAELLDYLNRMIGLMDSTLASLKSDLVEAEDENFSTTTDQNYVDISNLNSGLWDSLRTVWIGEDLLTRQSVDQIRIKRIYEDDSNQPYYWALSGQTLLFENDADDEYTLTIYYNKKTAELTLTDSMPYHDIFNEVFREMLVAHAKAKKENRLLQTDAYYQELFSRRAMQENLRRNFIPKPYQKDF